VRACELKTFLPLSAKCLTISVASRSSIRLLGAYKPIQIHGNEEEMKAYDEDAKRVADETFRKLEAKFYYEFELLLLC
jgi:hypothetical protein